MYKVLLLYLFLFWGGLRFFFREDSPLWLFKKVVVVMTENKQAMVDKQSQFSRRRWNFKKYVIETFSILYFPCPLSFFFFPFFLRPKQPKRLFSVWSARNVACNTSMHSKEQSILKWERNATLESNTNCFCLHSRLTFWRKNKRKIKTIQEWKKKNTREWKYAVNQLSKIVV